MQEEVESFVYQKLMAQRHIAKGLLALGLSPHELGLDLAHHAISNKWVNSGGGNLYSMLMESLDSLQAKGLIVQFNKTDKSSKWLALLPSEIANNKCKK